MHVYNSAQRRDFTIRSEKTNYLYHKKRALLKAAGFLNLAKGILSVAFAWLLGMSNSIF